MQAIFSGITAALAVFISFCKGAQRYAEAFEATGNTAKRIANVGDKYVEQWEIEQDANIARAKAQVAALANKAK